MSTRKKNLIPFISNGKSENSSEGTVADYGKIGTLDYRVYTRGVIHISDGTLTFKKNPDLLEEELNDCKINELKENEEIVITGSGDNADLIIKLIDGDAVLSLRQKEYGIIYKLRSLISSGKTKKNSK